MKTWGSKDKVYRRRTRSDKGKKRKIYAHKKTKSRRKKNGLFIPYVSKRKHNDLIKIWLWSVTPTSHEGIMNFHKNIRRKMHRYVYGKTRLRMDVEPEMLSTKDNIAEICLDNLWAGEWLLKMWGGAKNKFHTTARAVARIKITNHPEGMSCKVYPSYKRRSLRKYWFWRDG